MSETIIVSLISLLGTLGGTLGGILVSNKITKYRREQLENKVEKHNQVIDRVYELEKRDEVEKEEIRVINHRVADLEDFHK